MIYLIQQTEIFAGWRKSVRDQKARIAIVRRIDRASAGNFGDVRPVGEGVSEMRIDIGAGYRVYFVVRGKAVVILLCGGDKKSQQADIEMAKAMAREV